MNTGTLRKFKMHIKTASNGQKKIVMSCMEWRLIGKRAGWFCEAGPPTVQIRYEGHPRSFPFEKAMSLMGWRKMPGKGHTKWLCPCGSHYIVDAGTPSDHRALRNNMSRVWRCPDTAEKFKP